jgi:WD40 repeat protein
VLADLASAFPRQVVHDHTIQFWNIATSREVGSIQIDYAGEVAGAFFAFSPDGQTLIANASDEGLRSWRVPTLAEIDAAEANR